MTQTTDTEPSQMRYTRNGRKYTVIDRGTVLVPVLPASVFDVGYSDLVGCFLTERETNDPVDFKVYGKVNERVSKATTRFIRGNGSLGILLSGESGMGKTLFMRILSETMVKAGYPVVIVSRLHPGLSEFLGKIDQPFVVLVDEFEKLAHDHDDDEGATDFLTLLDGVRRNNMMFVASVNRPDRLNKMYFNRPGRFYYVFRFNRLSKGEISEYMTDVLGAGHEEDIARMTAIANVHHVNYDVLRAVCNELKAGFDIDETLRDLNCTEGNGLIQFRATATVRGIPFTAIPYLSLGVDEDDSFEESTVTLRNRDNDDGASYIEIKFPNGMLKFDKDNGGLKLDGSFAKIGNCRVFEQEGSATRSISPRELGTIRFEPIRSESYSIASAFIEDEV